MEKLNQTVKQNIPNTENSIHPEGFFGFFEAKDGYNKLIAYGPNDKDLRFSWVHREYTL